MFQASLKIYLQAAYKLPPYRIVGPAWMESERYDIAATMPPDTPDDHVLLMLQRLLEERFQLTIHREQRETSVYILTVGKNGSKLETSAEGTRPEVGIGFRNLTAKDKSMNDLAGILTLWSDRPVVDMTGLDGYYDFKLDWNSSASRPSEGAAGAVSSGSALARAGSDPMAMLNALPALGLKVEGRKMSVEFLIVDHAEKIPTEN